MPSRWPIEASEATHARLYWSRDGTELFYRSGPAVVAVPVTTTPTFAAGRPAEPFAGGPYDFTQAANWDVTPDGRFLMILDDPSTTRQFRVVLNWFEELRGAATVR